MDSHSDVGCGSRFDAPVTRWTDIPGWFQWRDAQQEAVAAFGGDSIFVEVGCYLGRSLCSLAELVCQAGNGITLIGVDTCRGSGPEGQRDTDAHRAAVLHGGGTMAGLLHRNVIACGFTDKVQLLISSSVAASVLFQDDSLTMGPHRCAPRLRQCLRRTSRRGLRKSPAAAGCPAMTTTPTNGRAS